MRFKSNESQRFSQIFAKIKIYYFFLSKKLVLGVMVKMKHYFERGKTN